MDDFLTVDIIGYIAGTLTTICHIPQAWKVVTTKNVSGISLLMYPILLLGIFMWLAYGVYIENMPLIVFNVITAFLAGTIYVNVLIHKNKN